MNNVIAGRDNLPASDMYPTQNLTMQSLAPYYPFTACDACNLIPTPDWAYGSCAKCERDSVAHRYFDGRALGQIRMTEATELVPRPQPPAPSSQWCALQKVAGQRGDSWQFYGTGCNGPPPQT